MVVRTATFNRRKYKVVLSDRLDGWCDQYANNERYLLVMAEPDTQTELITIVHESLHASDWCKTEETIDRVSTEIGRLLWRLGYRKNT